MAFDFGQCRSVLLQGILDALTARANQMAAIPRLPNVEFPISGISLELAPWEGALGISLRLVTEFEDDRRYSPADWEYFDLVSNNDFPGLQPAGDLILQAYSSEGEDSPARHEMAHLVFLAGAEALLDPQVAQRLHILGVSAPVYGEEFLEGKFEYMVFDQDKTVSVNYCELVLANRVTAKWLGAKT